MKIPGRCPYCGGGASKKSGRVAGQPSHLAFGYGERVFECRKCGEKFVACFPIPPKSHSGWLPKPNPRMIKVRFKEGVTGYAGPVVLTVRVGKPEIKQDAVNGEKALKGGES